MTALRMSNVAAASGRMIITNLFLAGAGGGNKMRRHFMSIRATLAPLCRASQKGRISEGFSAAPVRPCGHSGHWTSVQLEIRMWICRDCWVSLSVSRKIVDTLVHVRSEEHTSELQSLRHLVCRLLLPPRCPLFPYTTLFRSLAPLCRASQKGRISEGFSAAPVRPCGHSGHWTSVQLEIRMWICRDCWVSLSVSRKIVDTLVHV